MRRLIGFVAAGILLVSCSENEIEITNLARERVFFIFRGESYFVEADTGFCKITDIPNGRYEYETKYVIPDWAKEHRGDSLAGFLEFQRNQTRWLLMYGSTSFDSVYTVNLNTSSTDRIGAVILGP